MEKFMLIFQGGMNPNTSPEAMQANMGKWMAWIDKLNKDGKYVAGEPLLPGGKKITGSHKNVTDGPYTEGKEVVGGFFIVIGLFTRWAALIQIPILLGAVFFVNVPKGIFAGQSELGLSIIILLLLCFFFVEGGGPISMDDYFRRYWKINRH